ncbi:GAF domain-containing protein [Belnapia sp. T6]|uniref:GAF domain-containing protein n=1 Tax=Belnapia mucosa TaxID=2804532 RepID=A0ABS1V9D4_9PROT|nr:GAF domain-containing protein [Belnapia mucosa]MBL6458247.1 GAF domain-containing protein [Belnapia mucosa]
MTGLVLDHLAAMAAALADPQQPSASFAALDAALGRAVGHRFLTMLAYRWEEGVAERLYSSRPDLYPARGRKAFAAAPTQRRVAEGMQPYIGRDAADIRRDFPDHETIFALGCESILNMPVVWRGRALGQVNLLHEARHYVPDQLPLVRALVQMAIPAFLAATATGQEDNP